MTRMLVLPQINDKNEFIYMKSLKEKYLEVAGYVSFKVGKWEYFNEDGKIIKVEQYDINGAIVN